MHSKKLVSYCLFTYNQEKYIKASIEGALLQTYSPLEIIISDDCSTDSTFQIIQETIKDYSGPHKIIVNQNKKNLGIGGHVSKVCYSVAKGEYFVLLAGDDISMKSHVQHAVDTIEKYTNVNMIDFNAEIINGDGDFVSKIDLNFKIKKFTISDYVNIKSIQSFAPGRIIRRELIECFDPISIYCPTEDSVFVIRSLLTGGFIRINTTLVQYRKHDSNISNSDGLAKLSNTEIISQYIVDIIHLLHKGVLNENQFDTLIRRFYLELKIRGLLYSKNSYKIHRIIKIILLKILKYKYLFQRLFNRLSL